MNKYFCLILTLFCSFLAIGSNQWPNHDISTLKLLQVIHRHGDRTPIHFTPNDPFKNESYWPEGIGELTAKGRYRMYRLGKFIRQEYDIYLGHNFKPNEVFARSSLSSRCFESLSCLLSGAYPPKPKARKWNWGKDEKLANMWQPILIQTFMPKNDDLVCNQVKKCPLADKELDKFYKRKDYSRYLNKNRGLFKSLKKITGSPVETNVISKNSFVVLENTLKIETENNLFWRHVWTRKQQLNIIKELEIGHNMAFRYEYVSPVIKRLRAGGLVKELIKNIQSVVENKNQNQKIFIYSTHDIQVALLMHALNIYNDAIPPYGAALLLELHQKENGYFVRLYYQNETEINSGIPQIIHWTDCHNLIDCPLNQYLNSTKHLLYDNFDEECKTN